MSESDSFSRTANRWRRGLAIAWACLCVVNTFGAEAITIRWLTDGAGPAVEVAGLPPDRVQSLAQRNANDPALAIYAEQSGSQAMPAVIGTVVVAQERLRFEPLYPFARGVRYRAEFRSAGAEPVISFFELPADTSPSTTAVAEIFPSTSMLPQNQLKFYVHFSAPMSRGGTYAHIHLREAGGPEVELAFLELDEELWDPTMTRLTLLIDPGRIKRGVKPLEDTGPVFEEGKSYVLTVDAACNDAADKPLAAAFEKKFRIAGADRSPPEPSRWKISPPGAGTRGALVVDFDESLDHALALRLLSVAMTARTGKLVSGDSALANEERHWTFVPDTPWQAGRHSLVVATTIEDLAGNNVGKVFDVDVFENVERRVETRSVSVPFDVK